MAKAGRGQTRRDSKRRVLRPGESVRITPVKDVIEPRVKVEGRGGVFPRDNGRQDQGALLP